MRKSFLLSLTLLTTTVWNLAITPTKALTFGEALGIGAGVVVLDKVIDNNQQRYQYRSPQQEYQRGLEDGYNHVRYDNPRNSGDYDKGYTQGGRRRSSGWRSPFNK